MRGAAALPFLIAANTAMGQFNADATLVSDYRYRGVSFSQGEPEAQLAVGYDDPAGWYAGGQASGAKSDGSDAAQFIAYGGYSRRWSEGSSWEAGASSTSFARASDYNYMEAYVGLASDNYSGRVYYSPSYLNQKTRTMYAEFNGAYALQENLHLLGHCGYLYAISANNAFPAQSTSRYDARLGVSARLADWVAEVAWVALQRKSTEYPTYDDRNPRAVVFSISYSF